MCEIYPEPGKRKCSKCSEIKDFSKFHKSKSRKYGIHHTCKVCCIKIGASNRKKFKENLRSYHKEYYKNHKIIYKKRNEKWAKENRERLRELWRKHTKSESWRKKHKHNQAMRRVRMQLGFVDKFKEEIKEIYKNCPDGHHVDHIVPINGKNVCGLHVPWNLQYLTAEENLKKNNKF